MELRVGQKFFSYIEFDTALKNYQSCNLTQFSSVSAERIPEGDPLRDTLRYRVLRLQCKQGQKRETKCRDHERPQQRSYKVGCPVMLNVRLNRPKGEPAFLRITRVHLDHVGHDVSSEMFTLYPEQRRIVADEVDITVLSSMTMKPTEQRSILERRHGSKVLRQDVYNLQKKLGVGKGNGGRDDFKCEKIIKEVISNGGHGEVGRDENGDFLYVAFLTNIMKDTLQKYPECFIMDCTYKVNNYLYPLLTVMVIDGEGHGIPVFHSFMAKEDRNIIEQCLHVFAQQFNPGNTQCFIVDKDMAEIAAIGTVFPGVPVNLCQFHISQAVERYLRKELGKGSSLIQVVLDSFMNQVNTESEEEFDSLKLSISSIVPQSVTNYFEVNWWSKRHLWAACCNTYVLKFHATTTNTIENFHSKIKKSINEKLNLSNVLTALITYNEDKITDQQRQQLLSANCRLIDHRDKDAISENISNSLTRFGAQLVKRELSLSADISYTLCETSTGECIVTYRERQHITTSTTCTCSTFGHFHIPCRHIFATRRHRNMTLFEDSLVPDRFKNQTAHVIISSSASHEAELPIQTVPSVTFSLQTSAGRYRKARSVCDKICEFLSILGVNEFQEKLQQLEDFTKDWSSPPPPTVSGPVVAIVDLDSPAASYSPSPISSAASDHVDMSSSVVIASPVPAPNPHPSPRQSSVASTGIVAQAGIHPCPLPPTIPAPLVSSSDFVPSAAGPISVEADIHPCPPIADLSLHSSVSADSCPADTSTVSSADVPSVWPAMNRLFKPRGRPSNKQLFTRLSTHGQRRRRAIPKKFSELLETEKFTLFVKSVSCHEKVPSSPIQHSELRDVQSFFDTVLDDGLDLSFFEALFEPSAWTFVLEGIHSRIEEHLFYCGSCKELDDGQLKMIQCEHCLIWYHFHCVGYSSKKKVVSWFCDACL